MGAVMDVQLPGFNEIEDKLASIMQGPERLLDAAGALVVSQTQRRIASEKTSPAGVPWAPWSPAYERTRHGNQSLLVAHGDMRDSLTYLVHGAESVEVGSSLNDPPYPAFHQFGAPKVHLPQREWLGLSTDNMAELNDLVVDFLERNIEA